jgi:hypothetical protein
MSALTNFTTAIDSAITLYEAGSYAAAVKKITVAELYLKTIPDSQLKGRSAKYDRESFEQIKNQIKSDQIDAATSTTGSIIYAGLRNT